jgi:TRAP transporter TAXI family solute receptor
VNSKALSGRFGVPEGRFWRMRWLTIVLMSCALIAGGWSFAEAQKGRKIIIGTGSISGIYFSYGTALAKITSSGQPELPLSVVATRGAVDNVDLLKRQKIHLAIVQSDIADFAFHGNMGFKERHPDIRSIGALYPEYVQIVLRAESPVRTFTDLKGLRVHFGASGKGIKTNLVQIMELYGMKDGDVEARYYPYLEGAWHLKQGNLDALVVVAGVPNRVVTELAAETPVKLLSLDEGKLARVTSRYPFLITAKIPANTYKGQGSEVKTVAVKAILITTASLPDDVVYNLTRRLFEDAESLGRAHPGGAAPTLANAMKGLSVPLHPGALRYYKEKGILK